ncbi:pre-mRNA-processing factor 39-like [Teleopsis dalmanni]|uniref:pre-mRNA-processing factor 39-like n=1 Tax=Teleopsis dalmanni TaxID=139649 RepID=UPI0018CE483B|nr:pre-mRNA-processing factor 39-like [Teleopsis dalmanni]
MTAYLSKKEGCVNMASASEEENVSGRRTRSGKKVGSPVRATRRSTRKQAHEQTLESEVEQSDIIKEMLAEAAQGVIKVDSEDAVIFDPDSQNLTDDQSVIYQEEVVEVEHQQHMDDNEIYSVIDDEHINSEVTVANDEKSSSFPFGIIGHSETSDEAQVEEVSEEINDSGVVENSLLASLVGDNANSLPSVGGCEDNDIKKEDFDSKIENPMHSSCEKMESDESNTEAAIAEDIAGVDDGSNATMVNTEIISEDELPLPTKPEINDAEEVSDEELPAPKRAELPADAEVISEDELPANSAAERKSPSDSPKRVLKTDLQTTDQKIYKRKADDTDSENQSITQKKSDEQYNPMSPTSESNDAPPIEKKAKLESDETEAKDRRKDKEKEKEREKTKEKEKERDKEKERKRLPELDKYWRAVKEDTTDFTGWTYLLQYVDNESDAEAAREAYDAFLSLYPYCYGYWRKYADYEKRKGIKANCNAVSKCKIQSNTVSIFCSYNSL